MVILSFVARLYRGLINAQALRAERDVARYRHLLPRDLEVCGNGLTRRNEDRLPFGR